MTGPRQHILTDTDAGVYVEQLELAEGQWSVRKRRLRGGLCDGVDMVEVDNGALKFSVLPTRGMGIWRGWFGGLFLGWHAPVSGPVHPAYVNLADRAGLGWLQGFDELLVRCGLDSNGAPCVDTVIDNNGNPRQTALPLHGRIANTPAKRVAVEFVPQSNEIAVAGVVEEAMLFGQRLRLSTRISTVVGSNRLTVADEVTNLRATQAEMQMLYHCNFGPPFLAAGSELLAPTLTVAPRDARAAEDRDYARYPGPTAGYVEQVHWHDLAADADGMSLAALVAPGSDKAVVTRFTRSSLPCFAQWKNTAAESDGYVTGLEPGTNFPNPKPFERQNGRVVVLPPGGKWSCAVAIEVIDSAAGVDALRNEVAAMLAGRKPAVLSMPRKGWSPGA